MERPDALLSKDLLFRKIGTAHLSSRLISKGSPENFLKALDLIPEDETARLFTKAASLGCGIELNHDVMSFEFGGEDTVLRPFRIAKSCGCKFYLGTDAHHPKVFERMKTVFEHAVDHLGLTGNDKFMIGDKKMKSKPLIGILGAVDSEHSTALLPDYAHSIEASGGVPMLLPYVERDDVIGSFISSVDGIMLSGGVDVDPSRYGEKMKPVCGMLSLPRDELEFKAIAIALEMKKPILGICRGAQVINVALGGTLYQDIRAEAETDIIHRQKEGVHEHSHCINVNIYSPFGAICDLKRIRINSFHHQAVNKLGAGLRVMATADDGIIEAFYLENYGYLRGYQWHPERLFDVDPVERRIFEEFIEASKNG